jgi:hypothetical protein
MLLSLAQWIENLAPFAALRAGSYPYPIVLALHLTAISLFAGAILLTDLRLLGWALRDCPVADVVDTLRWPKRIGFLLAASCGLLLFCAKAEEYYYNVFFRTKLILFALIAIHAIVFRRSVYGKPAELDRAPHMPARAKAAAGLSLLLWLGVLGAGRAIGYVPGRSGLHFSKLENTGPEARSSAAPRPQDPGSAYRIDLPRPRERKRLPSSSATHPPFWADRSSETSWDR